MITASSPWRLSGTVSFATWSKTILNAGGPADLASYRTWDAAGDLSALCLSMLGEESSYGSQHGADPASSLNPLNLRPRGGDGFLAFDDYAKCIVNWRVRLLDAEYAYKDTVSIADLINVYAPPSDSNDTAGYVRNVVQRLTQWQQGGTNPVTTYQIVGLPGPGIELPVPLSHQIIPLSQSNQRPGIKLSKPFYWVQHETANTAPGADAAMHSAWLNNGADGSQLSFHFAVDDGAIYQMIPIDEVTWQAADGSGPGNMNGISCELCVNAGIDTAKARHNAEALAGGIMKALGMPVSQCKRHWDFNAADPDRHHCPDEMMNENYWPTFVSNVGTIIGATPVPPKPDIPTVPWSESTIGHQTLNGVPAIALLAEVTAKSAKSTRVAVYRDASCKKGTEIGYVQVGKPAKVRGTFRNSKGRVLYLVDLGTAGVGRSWRSGFVESLPTP